MKNWTKRIIAVLCSLAMVLSGLAISVPQEVKAADSEPTYVTLDGFENVTIKDFSKNGAVMSEAEHRGPAESGTLTTYSLTSGQSLNKKLLSMKVIFEGGSGNARLDVAGSGDWTGFSFFASANANYAHIYTNYGVTNETQGYDIDLSQAGVSSPLGTELLLQMSLEFVDTTLNVGVYVNGVLCGTYAIAGCDMSKFGNCLGIYVEGTDKAITVSSVKFPVEPVELEGFDTLSIEDFTDDAGNKMTVGRYEGHESGPHNVYSVTGLSNLDKKLVSMKILFEGGSYMTSLIIGGNGGWCGFNIHPSDDGSQLVVDKTWISGITTSDTPTLSAATAGVSSFINNEFILQLSFEYGEVDENNKADLTLGIYIDGKLYNGQTFTIADCDMDKSGNVIALYRQINGKGIVVNSIREPIMPDESFEKITFADYGIVDKKYPCVSGDLAVQNSVAGRTTLDKTVTCGSILMEGGNSSQIIWAGKNAWDGLRMFPSASGTMKLSWYVGNTETLVAMLSSNVAGVNFIGEEYDIMLSAELVGNDVKIGIWFNGVLYNQEFFVAEGMAEHFGNCFSVYCASEGDAITLSSVPELLKQPGEHLDKVTFLHYEVEDGTYDHANVSGAYPEIESANGSVLCGDIRLSGSQEIDLMWGFTDNSWFGVRLTKYTDVDELRLIYQTAEAYTEPLIIEPATAGVDFNNETFNLMWSMELVDNDGDEVKNDLKVGLWFNGYLYQNQYCYIKDYALTIGNKIETYCAEGSTITFTSDEELSSTVPVRHTCVGTKTEAVDATCQEPGNIAYWTCECGKVYADADCTEEISLEDTVIEPIAHTIVHQGAIEPGCHYNGQIEHWYCSVCGTFWADEARTQQTNALSVVLPAAGSDNLVHVEAKAPTCTAEGNIEYWHCPDCEQFWANEALTQLTNVMNVKLGMVEHTKVKLPKVEPQVGKTGLTEGSKCSVCDKVFEEQKKIPALELAAPKASKVTKATGGKKKITVKFKKVSDVTSYEIQIATKKNMKKGLKTYKVTKAKDIKNAKYVVKKLKAKTTYYVRIRTVKTVNGVTKTSSWSKAVKATKTK